MNIARILWSSKAAALRPRLACEITPTGAVAARRGAGDQELVSAFAPLPPGIFSPGLKAPIFSEQGPISSALRQALDAISQRETKITLVIPDASVRVLLLDFDSLPGRAAEVLPILRFRLRKLVPFEVEDAAISYQITSSKDGLVRTIVVVTPATVVAEYEGVAREAGYEPGSVLPSTLAALAAIGDAEPSLVVNRNANSVTTAITRQNELLLHRTLELTSELTRELTRQDGAAKDSREPGLEPILDPALAPMVDSLQAAAMEQPPGEEPGGAIDELQRSVSVAIAYFEDTLAAPPRELLSSGPGGAAELIRLLGDATMPVRDLVSTPTTGPATGSATSMPRGMLASVRGALAD